MVGLACLVGLTTLAGSAAGVLLARLDVPLLNLASFGPLSPQYADWAVLCPFHFYLGRASAYERYAVG